MKTKAEIRAYAEEVIADIKAARELNESEGIMTDYMRERSFDSQDMWESIAALAKELFMDCRNEEDPICIEHNNITFAEAMDRTDELLHKIGLNNFFVDGVSAISIAAKLISHINKYSWHDLRENPEDLPKEDSCVVTAHKLFGNTAYAICTYENGAFDDGINPSELLQNSLLAWRYIDEFEGSDNN